MFTERLRKFHFWCHKVLPLVYDNSLSYYEVLCKLREFINEFIDILVAMGEKLDEWDLRMKYFEETFAGFVERFGEFEDRFAEFEQRFAWFEQRFAEFEDRFDYFNEKFAYFDLKFAEMLQAFADIQALVNALNNRVDAVESDIAAIKNQLNGLQSTVSNLNNRVTNIESNITNISGTVGDIQTTLNNINSRLNTLETNYNSLNTRVTNVENSISSMQTSISNLQSSLNSISSRLSTVETNLSALTTRVNTLDTFVKKLPSDIVDAGNIFGTPTTNSGIATPITFVTTYSGDSFIVKDGNTYKKYLKVNLHLIIERYTQFRAVSGDTPAIFVPIKSPYKLVEYQKQLAPVVDVLVENHDTDNSEWTNVTENLKYITLAKNYNGLNRVDDNTLVYRAKFTTENSYSSPIRVRLIIAPLLVEDTSFVP